MNKHKFVFVCGLHRSGTSLLFKCLRDHPLLSGFNETEVPEDEGQHLQSVYPVARVFGGPGKFGFNPQSHLTEFSSLVTNENREKLFKCWEKHWDTTKPFLLEKSPPNLISTRFLQAIFPNSFFIVLLRHPVAVSFATQKWSRTSTYSLIKHWLVCHNMFNKDSKSLSNLFILKYEFFVNDPQYYLNEIYNFLGLPNYHLTKKVLTNVNEKYFDRWRKMKKNILSKTYLDYVSSKFEFKIKEYGYSLNNLEYLKKDF